MYTGYEYSEYGRQQTGFDNAIDHSTFGHWSNPEYQLLDNEQEIENDMANTISGKVIAVLPLQSGAKSNGGEWRKQDYVIETHDQYPKKCCFTLWNEKIDQFGIQQGNDLDVSIDIDAREWNGKWFNSVTAWNVVQRNVQPKNYENYAQQQNAASAPTEKFTGESAPQDDLPF